MNPSNLIAITATVFSLATATIPGLSAPAWMPGADDTPDTTSSPQAQPVSPAPKAESAAATPTASQAVTPRTESSEAGAGQASTPAPATSTTTQAPAHAEQPRKPVKLFGRIEELCEQPGAKIPIKLQALTPKFDTRRPLTVTATQQSARASGETSYTYPVDWQGVWSGPLKIWTAQFDQSRWRFDAAEVSKEQQLLRPGTSGQATFSFTSDRSGRIQLQPTQIVFSAPMDQSRASELMQQMQQMLGPMAGALTASPYAMEMMKSMPYMYALHLGNLTQGIGVTGNILQSTLLKNDVKLLAPGTLEQVIVTYNVDQSRATGRTHYGYSESALRFTRIRNDQLYVQAAAVSYDRNGKFEDKVVLYGTITRGQAAPPSPFPNFMNGGGLPQMFPFPQ